MAMTDWHMRIGQPQYCGN